MPLFKRSFDKLPNDRLNRVVSARPLMKKSRHPNAGAEKSRAALSAKTRERLLRTSAARFAQDGFAGTSVRDLAKAAEVNQSAISYYFGGKELLYQEALHHVLSGSQGFWNAALERQQRAAQLGTRKAAENALRQHIHEFVQMLFREEIAFTLMLREFMEPTEALVQVVAKMIGPNSAILHALVGQIRPSLKGTKRLDAYCGSIVGQCVHLRVARSLIAQLNGREKLDTNFLRQAAEHIADFSLAALRPDKRTSLRQREDAAR